MDKNEFKKYLNKLENDVILPYSRNGMGRSRLVSTKPGKLYTTMYGRTLGLLLDCHDVLAIDYYGFHKKSIGFIYKARKMQIGINQDHISVKVPVVSFASIHLEHILKYEPGMVSRFPEFKLDLIELRGFSLKGGING